VLLATHVANAQPAEPPVEEDVGAEELPPEELPPEELPPGELPPEEPPPEEEGAVDLTGSGQMGQPTGAPSGAPYPPPYPHYYPPPTQGPPPPGEPELIEEAHGGTQRNFGFGPRLAGFWAFGLGARAGHRYFGVDVSGGWQPLMPTIEPQGGEGEMEFFHSWQLTLMGYVAFNPDSTFVAGATGGYSYNSILGRGGVLAFDGIVNFSNHFGFHFHGGPGYYPDAEERMREKKNLPDSSEITSTPAFQMGIGAGLIYYP
jgi:hypothetical protein